MNEKNSIEIKLKKMNLFGVIASIVTLTSVFLPCVSVTMLGFTRSVSFIEGSNGLIILLLAIAGLIFAVLNKNVLVLIFGILELAVSIYIIVNFVNLFNLDTYSNDNPLVNMVAEGIKSMIKKGPGYYILSIGSVLTILAAVYGLYLEKTSDGIKSLDLSNVVHSFSNTVVNNKKNLIIVGCSLVGILVVGILIMFLLKLRNPGKFINNNTQYKLNDGSIAKNEWVKHDGDEYYFDRNGFKLTDQWIEDKYYVDDNGKKYKNFWYEEDGKSYYLGDDGAYLSDGIYEIDKYDYCFSKNGVLLTDQIVIDKNGNFRIANKDGALIKKEGIYDYNDNTYYIDNNYNLVISDWRVVDGKDRYFDKYGRMVYKGFVKSKIINTSTTSNAVNWSYIDSDNGEVKLLKNQWIEDGGKWYYAGENAVLYNDGWHNIDGEEYYFNNDSDMATNQIVDDAYYVDINGKKVKNQQIRFGDDLYSFDSNGVGKQVTIKTKSGIWKYYKTNNNTRCIYAENVPALGFLNCYANFTLSNNYVGIMLKYRDGTYKTFYSTTKVSITVNGKTVSNSERVKKVASDYKSIFLSDSQYQILLNNLKVDGNKINITINNGDSYSSIYYTFDLDSTGFKDVYPNL